MSNATPSASEGALEQFLPPAEAEVIRLFWLHGPLKPQAVHALLLARRPLAYTTAMSICSRLVVRGLLHRTRLDGQGMVYAATMDEVDFIAQALSQVLDGITQAYPDALSAYLALRVCDTKDTRATRP